MCRSVWFTDKELAKRVFSGNFITLKNTRFFVYNSFFPLAILIFTINKLLLADKIKKIEIKYFSKSLWFKNYNNGA